MLSYAYAFFMKLIALFLVHQGRVIWLGLRYASLVSGLYPGAVIQCYAMYYMYLKWGDFERDGWLWTLFQKMIRTLTKRIYRSLRAFSSEFRWNLDENVRKERLIRFVKVLIIFWKCSKSPHFTVTIWISNSTINKTAINIRLNSQYSHDCTTQTFNCNQKNEVIK